MHWDLASANAVLTAVAFVVVMIATGAAVVALFRANYAKATIDTLKESNVALTARVDELEGENQRKTIDITRLSSENDTLRGLVTGRAELIELAHIVSRNHDEMMRALGTLKDHT